MSFRGFGDVFSEGYYSNGRYCVGESVAGVARTKAASSFCDSKQSPALRFGVWSKEDAQWLHALEKRYSDWRTAEPIGAKAFPRIIHQ